MPVVLRLPVVLLPAAGNTATPAIKPAVGLAVVQLKLQVRVLGAGGRVKGPAVLLAVVFDCLLLLLVVSLLDVVGQDTGTNWDESSPALAMATLKPCDGKQRQHQPRVHEGTQGKL